MLENEFEFQVESQQIDAFGHMNNSEYLVVLEKARWKMITARGYGVEQVKKLAKGPVLLELELKFKKELLRDKSYVIHTSSEPKNKKLHYVSQRIVNKKNELCCEARFLLGLIDLNQRKLIELTPEWKKAVQLP